MAQTSYDEQMFRKRCIRELLDVTYILNTEKDRKMYKFVKAHFEDVRGALIACGYDIKMDDDAGLIMLVQDESVFEVTGFRRKNHQRYTTEQIRVLFTLWSIYLSKSLVNRTVVTNIGTINDNIDMNQFKIKPTAREEALKLFKKFKMIYYYGDERDEKTAVEIYPSICHGMPAEVLPAEAERLKSKLDELAGEEETEMEVEEEEELE